MPDQAVTRKAKQDLKEGKSASTAAGEFVHEEIEHVREGKHGARSPQQAIAIGLSEARRAGIPVKAPRGSATAATKKKAVADTQAGKKSAAEKSLETTETRSRATKKALKKEPTNTTNHTALSKHAKRVAAKKASVSK